MTRECTAADQHHGEDEHQPRPRRPLVLGREVRHLDAFQRAILAEFDDADVTND